MRSPGYRDDDRYSTGRRRVRDRGVEIGLGIGAGLVASVVLGIVLLSGVTPRDSARASGEVALAPSASTEPSTWTPPPLSLPSGSPAPLSTDAAVGPGPTRTPKPDRPDKPRDGANQPPAPASTPKPARTQSPPRPTEPPTPAPTEPPTPASPEPSATPTSSGPKEAVHDFYAAAEGHAWDAATAMWSPSMQENYPPDVYLVDRFADTSRIDVTSVETVSRGDGRATVSVSLVEYRVLDPTPRTIVGAWDLVRIDGVWLLDVPYF